jgi:hypothetical protein
MPSVERITLPVVSERVTQAKVHYETMELTRDARAVALRWDVIECVSE